jgi:Skp family chaperone for outer membrane proteins
MTRVVVAVVLSLTFMGTPASAQQTTPPRTEPAAAAVGGMKVAFINLQQVAGESAEGKIATARVQALNQKKVNELNDKNKQLQADQQKLAQGGSVLNDATRAQLEKEVEKLTVEIERFQQDANTEVTELQQQLQGEFQQKLMPIIETLVKAQGISVLFSITDAGVIYVDPGLDITSDVVKRFDAAMASSPLPAASKPAAPGSAAPAKPSGPVAPAPTPPKK